MPSTLDLGPRSARDMYSRAAWTIAFALVVYFINRAEYPGPAATLASVIILIGLVFAALAYAITWFTTTGQLQVRDQILDVLQLQGSERVLSLSHDLGIAAAKRLKSGKVIAIGDTEANEAARETAKQAGLTDKIRFEAGDVSKRLSYPDANFDTVISSRALAEFDPAPAVKELARVLKPGGRLTLHEIGDTATYEQLLRESNLSDIVVSPTSLPFGLGGRILSARKPA